MSERGWVAWFLNLWSCRGGTRWGVTQHETIADPVLEIEPKCNIVLERSLIIFYPGLVPRSSESVHRQLQIYGALPTHFSVAISSTSHCAMLALLIPSESSPAPV